MTDPRGKAPTAGEELEQEVREAVTAVPEGSRDDHDSEAGDALRPNLAAQRQASHPDAGPDADADAEPDADADADSGSGQDAGSGTG
jgi:hypothetical protein